MSTQTSNQYRTSNPAFTVGGLSRLRAGDRPTDQIEDVVTIQGAALKSLILLGLLMASAGAVLVYFLPIVQSTLAVPPALIGCMIGGCIGGLVLALWTIFVPSHSPVTAPLYALVEGLAIGAISTAMEAAYPGIALQAMGLTFGCLLGVLMLYGSGIIQVNDTFRAVLFSAMIAIMFVYLASALLGLFGVHVGFLHALFGNGLIGIGFSVVVCIVAALNFAIDFQMIIDAKNARAPRWFEWYLGFALLLTVVWLYLELLRLLAKLRSRN